MITLPEVIGSPRPHAAEGWPRRVVILRCSRFLPLAVDACRDRWPGAELRVVYQPGSEHELAACGIAPDAAIPFGDAPRLRPLVFVRSEAFRQLKRWQPDAAVLQWSSPDGRPESTVALCAALTGSARVHAVRVDGRWIDQRRRRWIADALAQAFRGLVDRIGRAAVWCLCACAVGGIGLLAVLFTPAWQVLRWRERTRLSRGW